MNESTTEARPSGPALRIAAIYILIGIGWILVSDRVPLWLTSDPERVARVQSVKGVAFVLVTGALLFGLVRRSLRVQARLTASLRQTVRRQDRMIENLPGIVYRCRNDDAWTAEFVAGNCEQIFGVDGSRFAGDRGASLAEWVHPDDRERIAAEVARSIERNRLFEMTYRIVRKDGSVRWVWERGRAARDEAGRVVELEGFVTDVTDRKRLEQQFVESQKMEAMGRLAGGVAHDFNNLLTAILGYSQYAFESLPAESPVREDLAEVRAAGERAASLTRQLLSLTRRDATSDGLPISVDDVTREFSRLLGRVIGENVDIRLEMNGPDALVGMDPGHLEQVLMNLAVNARDAMAAGGRITIGSEVVTEESVPEDLPESVREARRLVVLRVSDTGCGMDRETRQRIFEPFFTTKPIGKGTGLGLSTVYSLVQGAGGAIRVESEPGAGTTFRVYLPVVEAAAAAGEVKSKTRTRLARRRSAATALVVEDAVDVRRLVSAMLEEAGYRVLVAEMGETALELAAGQKPGSIDLVVTDLVLPSLDGIGVVRGVRARHPGVRAVIMSGYPTSDAVTEAIAPPFAWLEKPFTPAEFSRSVNEVTTAVAVGFG